MPGNGANQVHQGLVPGGLHFRLITLAAHARRSGHLLTNLTFFSALIVLAMFAGLVIWIFKLAAEGTIEEGPIPFGMGFLTYFILLEVLCIIGGVGYLFGCTIAALLYARGLYAKYVMSTSLELQSGELGLVIADEDLWQQLTRRLERGFFRLAAKVPYKGLERHLIFCVAHWYSLGQVSAGKKRFSRFRLNRSQRDFNQLIVFFQPKWWTIAGMVVLGFFLLGYALVIFPVVMVIDGSRYIIFYARLTALAEFYLG